MAQLGKIQFKVSDGSGNALSGVSVEVRKQGAQVNGLHAGLTTSFTVDAPGAIIAGDQVSVDTGSTVRSVSSITATNVTVGGAGFNSVADDSRLTDITLPTIYNDAIGNETKSNPLTTDAAGEAFCWVTGGNYDVLVSGGGATTKLYTDVVAVGGESVISNIVSGTAFIFNTTRALAATDVLLDVQTAGTSKFKVMGDGEIVAGAAGATHALTGNTTITGTLAADGITSTTTVAATTTVTAGTSVAATTTVTGGTGVIATTGNLTATAGDAVIRRPVASQGTALGAADAAWALSAGWGDTASKSTSGKDVCGNIQITCNGAGIAANPTLTFTFLDGAYASNSPQPVVCRGDIQAPAGGYWAVTTIGTSSFVATFVGTPVAGTTYRMFWVLMGR